MKILMFTKNQVNYGALLQAYALQCVLAEITAGEVTQIDLARHAGNNIRSLVFPRGAGPVVVRTAMFFLRLFSWRALARKFKRIQKFRAEYLHLRSGSGKCIADFRNAPPVADVYVVGSDQVFSPRAATADIFYLDFPIPANTKCIAYAPSFGISDFSDADAQKVKPWLKKFSLLSSRESSGAAWLSELTGKNVPMLLDPVFLRTEAEWEALAIAPRREKGSYVFVYDLNGGKPLIALARKIGDALNLPVVCQTSKIQYFYPVERIFDCGPRELIGYIANAAYVVTDSFHGTAFSILFRRDFVVYPVLSVARITDVLGLLHMKDHMATGGVLPENWQALSSADQTALESKRRESLDFLRSINDME